MRALVFGSGGFIGRHVVSCFAGRDARVVCADIADTGQANFVRIEGEGSNLQSLIRDAAPEVIVNCAGAASVQDSMKDPARDFRLNVAFVSSLLDSVRQAAPGARVVTLSSAAVYGEPASAPIRESAPTRPVSPYGWHKAAAEALCREYAMIFGVRCLSLRIFSAYGPGLRKQLFWDFYNKGRNSDVIAMFGTGKETRDFIHAADIADAIAAAVDGASFDGGALNVACGRSVSISEAVGLLAKALGWSKTVRFSGEVRMGDPVAWRADISALRELGFEPRYDLERGLREVAAWLNGL